MDYYKILNISENTSLDDIKKVIEEKHLNIIKIITKILKF